MHVFNVYISVPVQVVVLQPITALALLVASVVISAVNTNIVILFFIFSISCFFEMKNHQTLVVRRLRTIIGIVPFIQYTHGPPDLNVRSLFFVPIVKPAQCARLKILFRRLCRGSHTSLPEHPITFELYNVYVIKTNKKSRRLAGVFMRFFQFCGGGVRYRRTGFPEMSERTGTPFQCQCRPRPALKR